MSDAATAINTIIEQVMEAVGLGDEASTQAVLLALASDSFAATDTATSATLGVTPISPRHHAWLEILARAHGLVDPLQVPLAGGVRSDGTLIQTVEPVGATVVTTTLAAPSGADDASALTPQEAIWLEQLVRIYGAIDPLTTTATGRSDGTLSQTFTTVGATTTITTP